MKEQECRGQGSTPPATPAAARPAGAEAAQAQDCEPPPPLDLLRARHALGVIEALKTQSYGHYRSYVEAFPAAILQTGFGQALATLLAGARMGEQARNADHLARESLYRQVEVWLCRDEDDAPYRTQPDLMRAITSGSEDAYLRAQAEALAYLRWLKKFASAFLSKPAGAA
ncbi:MAG: type III-B CRISPR module-associated protein Cmr5 [Betaproteobacteria bacterium]|nr:type III-B CRISPR module-associated protein Cmr5 [Betaproteobacteria bacterium]